MLRLRRKKPLKDLRLLSKKFAPWFHCELVDQASVFDSGKYIPYTPTIVRGLGLEHDQEMNDLRADGFFFRPSDANQRPPLPAPLRRGPQLRLSTTAIPLPLFTREQAKLTSDSGSEGGLFHDATPSTAATFTLPPAEVLTRARFIVPRKPVASRAQAVRDSKPPPDFNSLVSPAPLTPVESKAAAGIGAKQAKRDTRADFEALLATLPQRHMDDTALRQLEDKPEVQQQHGLRGYMPRNSILVAKELRKAKHRTSNGSEIPLALLSARRGSPRPEKTAFDHVRVSEMADEEDADVRPNSYEGMMAEMGIAVEAAGVWGWFGDRSDGWNEAYRVMKPR